MNKVLYQNVNPLSPQTIHWLSPLRVLDEHLLFPMRRRNLTRLLTPYLGRGETILDVGSSCGRLAKQLMDTAKCYIEGIDVCLQPHACIPVRQYDGHRFPFEADSFDGVMMVDMLHHTAHPEQILREAKRVARHYIIIKDHYWDTPIDLLGLKVADYIGNAPYGINLPYNYLKLSAWMQLFHELGLKATNIAQHRYLPIDPCKHVIFRLET
jgi:2-polyprenyl-3-methyl-5-hydroxy-6-metoxy-1,4-benzoquinol methylase